MRRNDTSWIFQAQEISAATANKLAAAGSSSKLNKSDSKGALRTGSPFDCFDKSRIGTHTRHGVMPGPRGIVAAKINQDRGVVCWPFNGSFDEALICVFDGHGSKGERVADDCMLTIPSKLEDGREALRTDPASHLMHTVVEYDQQLLSGELANIAHTGTRFFSLVPAPPLVPPSPHQHAPYTPPPSHPTPITPHTTPHHITPHPNHTPDPPSHTPPPITPLPHNPPLPNTPLPADAPLLTPTRLADSKRRPHSLDPSLTPLPRPLLDPQAVPRASSSTCVAPSSGAPALAIRVL